MSTTSTMSLAANAHPIIANYVVPVVGLALCGSGLYGIFNPASTAKTFGVRSLQPRDLVFYPGLAGRNLSAGLATFALLRAGQYHSLGIFLMCWANTGIWDVYLMMNAPPPVTGTWIHLQNIVILLVSGSALAGYW